MINYLDKKNFYIKIFFLFFVPDCVDDCVWSLGSGKQENWALVINRIRRTGLMQFRTGLMQFSTGCNWDLASREDCHVE